MRVTPWNIARFWKRLMFPPHRKYLQSRFDLQSGLPWEPWLHCAVWLAVIWVLVVGEQKVLPPLDGPDWVWIPFGLLAPPIGFASVWMLEFKTGPTRYVATWLRMASDIGLAVCLLGYQLARIQAEQVTGWPASIGAIADTLVWFSVWYVLTLVWRDIRFIAAVEHLASEIQRRDRDRALQDLIDGLEDGH